MPKRWQPTPQEIELIADMLDFGQAEGGDRQVSVHFGKHPAALPGQGASAAPRRRGGMSTAREVCQNAPKHLTANRGVAAIEAAKTLFFAE